MNSTQAKFDNLYITSAEICRSLGVTRHAVFMARRKGLLPDCAIVNGCQVAIWERDVVAPYLDKWAKTLGVNA